MSIAEEAAAATLRFEAKKISYKQSREGMLITLSMHPNDVPAALAIAPLGTRYMVVLVELDDDEKPVVRDTPVQARLRDALEKSEVAERLRVVGKERYAAEDPMKQAMRRSGILAKTPEFIAWANESRKVFPKILNEEHARVWIHRICGISSRREIATDETAYHAFLKLEARYLEQTGRRAEAR